MPGRRRGGRVAAWGKYRQNDLADGRGASSTTPPAPRRTVRWWGGCRAGRSRTAPGWPGAAAVLPADLAEPERDLLVGQAAVPAGVDPGDDHVLQLDDQERERRLGPRSRVITTRSMCWPVAAALTSGTVARSVCLPMTTPSSTALPALPPPLGSVWLVTHQWRVTTSISFSCPLTVDSPGMPSTSAKPLTVACPPGRSGTGGQIAPGAAVLGSQGSAGGMAGMQRPAARRCQSAQRPRWTTWSAGRRGRVWAEPPGRSPAAG